MNELLRRYAFAFLALRALIDLSLAVVIYRRAGSLVPAAGLMLVCSAFYILLYFGLRNEEFPGRYGRRVILWREPVAYWFIVGFLVVFHLSVTVLVAGSVSW
ncbi:MAG TPA: hypothetical protein VF659_06300 [Pyrinomonadaceae bacterium]